MNSKPSMKVLKESEKVFNVELPKGDVDAAADALYEHFLQTFGEENMAECQTCKKMGPEWDEDGELIPSCPYCGVLFDTAEAEEVKPDPEEEDTEDDEEDDEEDTEDDEEEEVKKPAPKPAKKKKTTKAKAKGKKKAAKGKKTPAKKRGRPTAEPVELVPMTPEQEDDLNKSIERIHSFRKAAAKNTWQLGNELNKINDGNLWLTAFGCKTFFEFAATKLDMSRSGAYKAMKAAREFDEETLLEIGIKRAELISTASESNRETLIEKAKEGASHPELRSQLNKLEGRGPKSNETPRLTLNGRVKQGDIEINWLGEKSHQPIKRANVKNKYATIKLTDEVELFINASDDDLGLVVSFKRIETTDR